MKRVAILQSNYIPWRGYFDLIDSVDEFIVYDQADYTKHDWRNRNVIKTANGPLWLTIPVATKGLGRQAIDEVRITDRHWAGKHWRSIAQSYGRTPCFSYIERLLTPLYDEAARLDRLHDVNLRFLRACCAEIGIDTAITNSRDYATPGDRTERLVALCRQAGATHYVTGPAARAYLEAAPFEEHGIQVEYFEYQYRPYPQPHGPFEATVSIVDTLAALGPKTREAFCGGGLNGLTAR